MHVASAAESGGKSGKVSPVARRQPRSAPATEAEVPVALSNKSRCAPRAKLAVARVGGVTQALAEPEMPRPPPPFPELRPQLIKPVREPTLDRFRPLVRRAGGRREKNDCVQRSLLQSAALFGLTAL